MRPSGPGIGATPSAIVAVPIRTAMTSAAPRRADAKNSLTELSLQILNAIAAQQTSARSHTRHAQARADLDGALRRMRTNAASASLRELLAGWVLPLAMAAAASSRK